MRMALKCRQGMVMRLMDAREQWIQKGHRVVVRDADANNKGNS